MAVRIDSEGRFTNDFDEPVGRPLDPYHSEVLREARFILSEATRNDPQIHSLIDSFGFHRVPTEVGMKILAAALYKRVKAAEKALFDRAATELTPMIIVTTEAERDAILAQFKKD
jgi:hypothetical protein